MSTLLEQASLVMIPSGYKEDVVYSQIPTSGAGDLSFTRASNGTRVNSAGLVEDCPWNLAQYSEQFDNGVWSKYQSTVTANTTTAPNGTLTADSLIENFATDIHITFQIVTISAGVTTISVYAKANTRNHIVLYSYDNISQFYFSNVFDLSNGTTTGANQSIQNVGNGWYRCIFTFTTTVSGPHYTYVALSNGTNINYAGNGTSGVYIWGAQLNIGSTAKPYFPTTDRLNVPRLTYQNGGGGCPSLLLEKQSTNIVTYSEQFDNAAWTKGGSNSVTANAIISPDGTQNADFLVSTATNTAAKYAYQVTASTATPTATIYAKAGAVTEMMFYCQGGNGIYFNLTNGAFIGYYGSGSSTITSYSSVAVGNGWYRYSLTFNTSVTSIEVYMSVSANISPNIANGDGLYIWGAQLEASSYPTSYIPTTSSSATRVADACFKTGISSLIGQTSGSVFFDFTVDSVTQPGDPVLWYMKDGGAGERYVELYSNGNLVYAEIDGSGPIATITKSSLTVGRHKCAIAYATNDFVFYVDGVQIGTDTSGTPNGFSTFGLQYYLSVYTGQQKVNQAAIFKTRLTNAELASLTTI